MSNDESRLIAHDLVQALVRKLGYLPDVREILEHGGRTDLPGGGVEFSWKGRKIYPCEQSNVTGQSNMTEKEHALKRLWEAIKGEEQPRRKARKRSA